MNRAQNETYEPRFTTPWRGDANDVVAVEAFFSPETSGETARELVQGSRRTIDAYAPGVESWSGCGTPERGSVCVGCEPEKLRDEEQFVLFRDLINAANRGVRVRLLTNLFDNVHECSGRTTVMSYLSEIFEVKTYRTTTFQHSKVLIIDGETVSISSVNWSRTSFIENREAGVRLLSEKAASFAMTVFEFDYELAETWVAPTNGISDDDRRKIQDGGFLPPFPIPRRQINEPHYEAPRRPPVSISGDAIELFVSPDAGATTLIDFFKRTNTTLDVYTYQITDEFFAEMILSLAKRGVRVRVVLSRAIYGDQDRRLSTRVIDTMRAKSRDRISFYSSPHFYRYAHLKVVISDGSSVAVSTGNLSPSDLPQPIQPFPPHKSSINRDFGIIVRNGIVEDFQKLIDGDVRLGATKYRRPTKY